MHLVHLSSVLSAEGIFPEYAIFLYGKVVRKALPKAFLTPFAPFSHIKMAWCGNIPSEVKTADKCSEYVCYDVKTCSQHRFPQMAPTMGLCGAF